MAKDEVLSRTATGIPGFDSLIEGGILAGTTCLLSGACSRASCSSPPRR